MKIPKAAVERQTDAADVCEGWTSVGCQPCIYGPDGVTDVKERKKARERTKNSGDEASAVEIKRSPSISVRIADACKSELGHDF